MGSNNDSTLIDEKKKQTHPKPSNIVNNYVDFLIALAKIIAMILISILFGSSILYSCKAATANVLPTDVDCKPYGPMDPNVTPIDIDIDINKIGGDFYSTKINFPFNNSGDKNVDKAAEYNRSNSILDWLRKQKETYNSWGTKMYFVSILESLFLKNYSIVSSLLHFMNQNMYEFIIILLGPFFLLFASTFISIFNFFYSIYLCFIEFHWIFKENTNNKEGYTPKWQDVTFVNAYNFCISCIISVWIIILLCVTYTIGAAGITSLTSIIFFICLISAALMKSIISDGENIGKMYGVGKTFTDLLYSKMHYVMIIISLCMIVLSFSYLGGASGTFAIIACAVLFIGLIGNSIYNRQIPKDSTKGLINEEVEKAKRTCYKIKEIPLPTQSGGEVDLLAKLKKLSKKLSK